MNIETDTFGMQFDLQLLSKVCSIANNKDRGGLADYQMNKNSLKTLKG
jgi:hypothetical protein